MTENERNDLSDGEILWKEKKWRRKQNFFPIFKSVNDIEDKTLQNNQLESNENQNQCEKTVELSSQSDIPKTATHLCDIANNRATSPEGLKIFQKS